MALDAGTFMRTGARGSPSWPGHSPKAGYVDADCSDGIAESTCRRGGPYVDADCSDGIAESTCRRGGPYVDADCSDGIAESTCRRGGPYVFRPGFQDAG